MDVALRLLTRRAYPVAKLREKLMERNGGKGRPRRGKYVAHSDAPDVDGFSVAVERILQRLQDLRYLDDLRYCERWVEERSRLKPRGKHLLTQELRHKGISKEVIEQLWEGEIGRNFDEDAVELAEQVAQKKYRQLEGKLDGKNGEKYQGRELKNRLFRHLASRGFSYETIGKVVERFS